MRRIQQSMGVAVVALMASWAPARAWAGAEEQAAAEALFQEARQLMEQGKYAEACPKLVDSNKVDPAVGTLLYLGDCYEKNGQTASAWATFQAAVEAARKAGQAEREAMARDRANALLGKLSKITVAVPPAVRVAGMEVRRNGVEIGSATWGIALPVDPGDHTIVVRAPGKKEWSQRVQVAADGGKATIEVPALEDQIEAPASPAAAAAPTPSTALPVADRGTSTAPRNSQRVWAFVAGGVGVLGLVGGTVFGLQAKSKETDSEQYCLPNAPNKCSQHGLDLLDEGRSAALIANIGFTVGALGLVGGAVLYLTAPSAPSATASKLGHQRGFEVLPTVARNGTGLVVSGTF